MTRLTRPVAAASALLPAWAAAQTPPDPGRYDWGYPMMGGGWGGMILGPIFFLLVLAVTIAIAMLLVRWVSGSDVLPRFPSPKQTALDILKERFARGEIDRDEFEDRRRTLGE